MVGSVNSEQQIEEMYSEINKYYPKINREMVDDIIMRFDEIADLYYDNFILNDKELNNINNTLLTKRILNNEKFNTASTINTIMSFITAMFKFVYWYETEPENLFKHANIWDYLLCAAHEFDFKKQIFNPQTFKKIYLREMWIINERDIEKVYNEFMSIDLSDLKQYTKSIS